MSCILLRTASEADLHMDDSFNEFIYFTVWPLWGGGVLDIMHGRSRMATSGGGVLISCMVVVV